MRFIAIKEQGFSVLEALAALMVLNLLCLGLLAWQLQAIQAQRQALALQQAVAMAQDLSQRMQVHPGAWPWYQLGLYDTPPPGDCKATACNAQQWAQADLSEWFFEWQKRLSQARAQVQTTLTGEPTVEVLLAWPGVFDAVNNTNVTSCPSQQNCWQTSWKL